MLQKIREKIFRELKTHRHLGRSLFYLLALRGLQIVLGFAGTYFVTHSLTKHSFGEYQFILSCVGVMTVFSFKDMNNAVMQAIARGFHGNFRKAVPISFVGSVFGSFVLAGMAGWYFYTAQHDLAFGLLIAAVIFPFTHGLTLWKSINMGAENFATYFFQNGAQMLIMYPLIIISVLLVPDKFFLPLTIILLIPALQNVMLTVLHLKRIPRDASIEDGNTAYGVKTTLYSALSTITVHIDKLLLFFFLSPTTVATYVAADRIADLFRSFVQDTSVALAPKFAKYDRYTKKLDQYMKVAVVLYGAGLVAFAFTLLPYLITFLFGEKYNDSIPYAQILLCSAAVGNLSILQFRFIRSKIDHISFRNITVITAIARILMSLILIPWLGMTGALISVFLYRVFFSLVVSETIKKRYPMGVVLNENPMP
jgi:O-antigen/teichoic acid export membrane protein